MPSATIAYLLLVPELELTLEDVPQLWRRQLRDVLELPSSARLRSLAILRRSAALLRRRKGGAAQRGNDQV